MNLPTAVFGLDPSLISQVFKGSPSLGIPFPCVRPGPSPPRPRGGDGSGASESMVLCGH